MALKSSSEGLFILDQSLLPKAEKWLKIQGPDEMIEAIKALRVRGAPLIGVAAALTVAHYSLTEARPERWLDAIKALREARPTAVNLMKAMDRLRHLVEARLSGEEIRAEAEEIYLEDQKLCDRIAEQGVQVLQDGDAVLTHCNTGGLATAGVGTALGVIQKAHQMGRQIQVWVDETRPLLQGARLTAWELEKLEIPYTLICDNMAAMLMAQGRVHKIIVGSDRIAANGDFANKIGTYSLAVNAQYHRVPFYVAAPRTTVDPDCLTGAQIPIEERDGQEVRGFDQTQWAPNSSVFNPAFDVTPALLVHGWILDDGFFKPVDVKAGVFQRST
ncbi:MAG: S-methyl-5-thioribose-1-phosphate isomerase [Bdellovibrionales bacterium]